MDKRPISKSLLHVYLSFSGDDALSFALARKADAMSVNS